MASTDLYALSNSTLNRFLYADIGPLDGAGTLTVASLFGRIGHDPWAEAARLARLPVGAAVASLADMIAGALPPPCSLPEATAMAENLVALLPGAGAGPRPARVRPIPRLNPIPSLKLPRWPFAPLASFTIGLALLVALVSVWMLAAGASRPPAPQDGTSMADPSAREAPR